MVKKKNKKEKDYCIVKKLFEFPSPQKKTVSWKKYLISFFITQND